MSRSILVSSFKPPLSTGIARRRELCWNYVGFSLSLSLMCAGKIASLLFIVSLFTLAASILAFANVGQALLSNGECIRFLHIPFTDVRFRVGVSVERVLLASTVLSMIVAVGSVWLIRKRPNG